MSHQHVRWPLSGLCESSVQIFGDVLSRLLTRVRIAPHDSRTAISAGASKSCNAVMDARPALRTAEVESILEHDRRSTGASTVDLNSSTSDVDQLPRRRELARSSTPAHSFVHRASESCNQYHAYQTETKTTEPFHQANMGVRRTTGAFSETQRFSTGKPASFHACHPPTSALAFFHPAFLNWSAARALVASSIQAQ